MNTKISKELSKHRLEQAKEDLEASKMLYENKFINLQIIEAYYSIFLV